jgi:ATP-dependent protease ClpP protease subunit
MMSLLGRRGALTILAGLAYATHARAQEAPAAPQPTSPAMPPPPPTVILHPPTPPNTGIDRTKAYFVFFDQVIDAASVRNLRKQLANLVEAGVSEITLVINSPGGQIEPTMITYSFILALPATINTHAQGFVASAATLLFLAGQERSADRNAHFVFHPAQSPGLTAGSEQQLRDGVAGFVAVSDATSQIYHERTSLSDAEIERFKREVVIYTPEQAKASGVIQTIADLKIPDPSKAKIMFLD